MHSTKKLTSEEISSRIYNSTNGEYTTDGIRDKDGKCLITHSCGYSWKAIPKTIWNGSAHCPKCSRNSLTKSNFLDIIHSMSLECLSELSDEVKSKEKVVLKCTKCGKKFNVLVSNLLTKYRKGCEIYCLKCDRNNQKLNKLLLDKEITDNFEIKDVSGDYATCICKKCGKESKRYIYDLKRFGCKFCANNIKKTTEEIKQKISDITDNEYTLISDYNNTHDKLLIKHNKCGKTFEMNTINFIQGNHRCPYCHVSEFQKGIYEFIKNLSPDAIYNDRQTLIDIKRELDIYVPSKKLAIECNGLYWHSEKKMGKNKQVEKLQACNSKGIRLITIFEDEYYEHQDLVLNKIKHLLGYDESEKVYARKCLVKNISANDKNTFLNKYHIQGTCCSSINLGLFYKDELVAVMTFAKPRCGIGKNINRKNKIELTRFATNNNYRVIGGFSKLISYFKKNYSFDEIYSYGDLRWVDKDKNVYIKNNFVLSHINPPNYWYFYNKSRFHRFGFRKSAIRTKFQNVYDPKKTEFQMMDETKYKRIWDCGTAVFTLPLS